MGLFMSPWTHHPSGWGIHSLTGKRETICEWRHRFFVSVNQTKQQRDQSFAWCLSVNALIHLNISQKKTTSIFVFIPRNQVWSAQTDRQTDRQTYIHTYVIIYIFLTISPLYPNWFRPGGREVDRRDSCWFFFKKMGIEPSKTGIEPAEMVGKMLGDS